MPPVGFEPTISAGERPQNYALDRAATETGSVSLPWVIYYEAFYLDVLSSFSCIPVICVTYILGVKAGSLFFFFATRLCRGTCQLIFLC